MKINGKFTENASTFDAKFGRTTNIHGRDGVTPHIGMNGNWYIGDNDTGVRAQGYDGKDGYIPVKGKDYFDGEQGVPGYTPQKGVDYFDGQQGEKGDPFTYEDFTPEQLASLKGERGVSGVYVGSGDMPDGYNIQIDPDGSDVSSLVLSVNGIEPDENGNVEIGGSSAEDAVLYTPQDLTEEQKAQVRANIGAAPMSLFNITDNGDVEVLTSIKPTADALTPGLYIDKGSGKELDNPNWNGTTVFIPFPVDARLIAHWAGGADKDHYPTVYFYDENKAFIIGQSHSNFEQEEYDGKVCLIFDAPKNARYIRLSYNNNSVKWYDYCYLWAVTKQNEPFSVEIPGLVIPNADKQVKMFLLPYHKARFDDSFNYIAYSEIYSSGLSINTAEHFEWAAKQGFTALKGDVRPTADGGLIMCHDAGFTLHHGDTGSRIVGYNNTDWGDETLIIHDMTETECLALQHTNTDSYVCNFETYIRICKKYGKIAFITIRDEYMDEVVPAMFKILDKYSMRKRSIVNSFTIPSLEAVRAVDDNIMLSNVLNSKTLLTKNHIDNAVALGNCLINTFLFPFDYDNDDNGDGNIDGFDALSQSLEALAYAQEKDIRIYSAQNKNASDVEKLMAYGVMGAQMTVVPTLD